LASKLDDESASGSVQGNLLAMAFAFSGSDGACCASRCAWTISPRIEDGAKREEQDFSDTAVLDIAGCEKLFGSPEKIAHDLKARCFGSGI